MHPAAEHALFRERPSAVAQKHAWPPSSASLPDTALEWLPPLSSHLHRCSAAQVGATAMQRCGPATTSSRATCGSPGSPLLPSPSTAAPKLNHASRAWMVSMTALPQLTHVECDSANHTRQTVILSKFTLTVWNIYRYGFHRTIKLSC